MVAPITGPFVVTDHVSGTGPGTRFSEKTGYRQLTPHTIVLPYSMAYAYASGGTVKGSPQPFPIDMSAANDTGGEGCSCSGSPPRQFEFLTDQAVNLARAKFMGNLHESALMGVNLAERAQAAAMINRRLSQMAELLKLCYSAARGKPRAWAEIKDLFNQLRIPNLKQRVSGIRRGWRQSSKSLADLWLEFHFGWEPMVKDVQAAIDLLDTAVPTAHLRMHSRAVSGSYSVGYKWSDDEYFKAEYQGRVRATVFGSFEVTNMDLYRAQRLGLTNPFVLGWELIPFSFLVDWFTTVGEYLEQFDGTLGLTLNNVGYSTKLRTRCHGVRASYGSGWATTWTLESEGCYFNRYTTLPSVTLGLRPPKRMSVERGATAVSLLTQFLGRDTAHVAPVKALTRREHTAIYKNWLEVSFTP